VESWQETGADDEKTRGTMYRCMKLPCLVALIVAAVAGCSDGTTASSDDQAATTQVDRSSPPRLKMTTDIPVSITTPDEVKTPIGTLQFFDGAPTDATVKTVYDNLDLSRGVEVFLRGLPAASLYRLRKGNEDAGADRSHENAQNEPAELIRAGFVAFQRHLGGPPEPV
jgi:hypothetical protein